MKTRALLTAAAIAGALTAMAGSALAADAKPAGTASRDCFLSRNWDGWHAPDENTLYFRVNVRDIYKVDLSAGSSLLKWPDSHLVNVIHGSDYICSPLDLQLSVADSGGNIHEFLIAKSITKLTPEQVKAIPKKDLP